jgi:3-oxoacyl-[acyl-carrier protein] reductase
MPAQSIHAFAEKVALITDGTNPIGRATALQLALLGCYVIVGVSSASEENRRALSELKNLGTLANAVESDVTTVEGARYLVEEVEKLYGRLDLLINTAKSEMPKTIEEICENDWTNLVNENLTAGFFITQKAINLMKSRPKPVIVNVLSACDSDETAANIGYQTVQSAIAGMTRSMAFKLAPKFRVNAVAVSEKAKKNPVIDHELFKIEKGVAADDVARTIIYLLSSEAVAINGQIIIVG